MNPRVWNLMERLDAFSPELSRRMMSRLLRVASPFNGPLRASIEIWEPTCCRIRVANRRALHNHLGGVHAGALVTAGETPAGLLIAKDFPFSRYRLILQSLSTVYERQARCSVVSEARISQEALSAAREALDRGEPYLIERQTELREPEGARLATVRTTWQVKAWSQVKTAA